MEYAKILVPVVGSSVDAPAMKLACRLARRDKEKEKEKEKEKDKSQIWAVSVVAIKRALPLDAEIESEIKRAEDILDKVESVAEEDGFEIETDVLQAREVGPAIVDEAVERGVTLIVMGIVYKRQFGQFSLGDVVPYVLKNSPCPVILYQQ
ncbi:MAG TPA: universal stress protein [Dehalococcoidales bacterium]|nr:universal stress protein [Dehalococcoidales bacterium]